MAPGMVLFVSATPLLTEREQSLFICTARVAYSSTRETCHPRSLNSAQRMSCVPCEAHRHSAQRLECPILGAGTWGRAGLHGVVHVSLPHHIGP